MQTKGVNKKPDSWALHPLKSRGGTTVSGFRVQQCEIIIHESVSLETSFRTSPWVIILNHPIFGAVGGGHPSGDILRYCTSMVSSDLKAGGGGERGCKKEK